MSTIVCNCVLCDAHKLIPIYPDLMPIEVNRYTHNKNVAVVKIKHVVPYLTPIFDKAAI